VIEAIVFDLDGTLVRFPIDYETLFEEFRRIMGVCEVHPVVEVVSRTDGKTRELVFNAWDRAELAVASNTVVNEEGMKTYIEFFEKPKALVTLQGKKVVEVVLKQFGLEFDTIVTREDTLFRTEQLKIAIAQLDVEAGNVLFVGDTEGDAAAAGKTGCKFLKVK